MVETLGIWTQDYIDLSMVWLDSLDQDPWPCFKNVLKVPFPLIFYWFTNFQNLFS